MGLNFYMVTRSKSVAKLVFEEYELSEFLYPYLGYEIHIAKVSIGWRPLFQANGRVRTVAAMKKLVEDGKAVIFDEYGREYDWPTFKQEVLDLNIKGREHYNRTNYEGYDFVYEDFY